MVAGGGAQGASGGYVKAAVVKRALDDAVDDKAIGEIGVFVGAEAVGGVVKVAFEAVDGEGTAAVVEADYVLFYDVFGGADLDPLRRRTRRAACAFRRHRFPGPWEPVALRDSRGRRWPV